MTRILPPSDWVTTPELLNALAISRHTLYRRRDEGLLKIGKHYRIISSPQAIRPQYRWHLGNCSAYFEVPLERRG
ncbi:MAG: DNA-binding protein [Cyanobacteriota bacterium]|nr:DNA-binding protein [Cyanobacteriota bacterium]